MFFQKIEAAQQKDNCNETGKSQSITWVKQKAEEYGFTKVRQEMCHGEERGIMY